MKTEEWAFKVLKEEMEKEAYANINIRLVRGRIVNIRVSETHLPPEEEKCIESDRT